MNRAEIMLVIHNKSKKDGLFKRLYDNLLDLKDIDLKSYNLLMQTYESMNFKSPEELIHYFSNS